jgi:hypothetical protein
LATALYLGYHILHWIYVAGRDYWKSKREQRSLARARSNVEFYDRFESMLKRLGFNREAGQTPREFAHNISPALALSVDSEWNGNSKEFIDLYYGVRFGEQVLDRERQQQIEDILHSLSKASQSPAAKS